MSPHVPPRQVTATAVGGARVGGSAGGSAGGARVGGSAGGPRRPAATPPSRTGPKRGVAGRPLAFGAVLAVALLISTAPAAAHVDADVTEVAGDGTTTVVLEFDHGCTGDATTGLDVQLPGDTTGIEAEEAAGWTAEVDDTVVSWTGDPVPDHRHFEVTVHARFVGEEGTVVHLPTVQICETSESAWIEIPEGDEQVDHPAPSITLGVTHGRDDHDDGATEDDATHEEEAVGEDATHDEDDVAGEDGTEEDGTGEDPAEPLEATPADDDDESALGAGTTGLIIFLVLVAILSGGGLALYLRNRNRTPAP